MVEGGHHLWNAPDPQRPTHLRSRIQLTVNEPNRYQAITCTNDDTD